MLLTYTPVSCHYSWASTPVQSIRALDQSQPRHVRGAELHLGHSSLPQQMFTLCLSP